MCCKSWLLNLWVATKKRVMGVRLMITRLLSAQWRRISQIQFQSWKSLRRSAVSSVMAPQTSEAPTPLRDIRDLTSLRWKMNIVCHVSSAAPRLDDGICHASNQPLFFSSSSLRCLCFPSVTCLCPFKNCGCAASPLLPLILIKTIPVRRQTPVNFGFNPTLKML